ncbi:ABC transporter permease [Tomitella fengzijianii]|nr:ABC transporter permease [Tomitella fengzijianii]
MTLIKRVASAVTLMVCMSALVYALASVGGVDPARQLLGSDAGDAEVAELNHSLGVDRPLMVQFTDWIAGVARGDLGRSYVDGRPVTDKLSAAFPVTISMVLLTLVVVMVLSLGLAMLATRGGAWADRIVQLLMLAGHVVPGYLAGLLLLLLFAVQIRIFPVFGYVPFAQSPGGWLTSLVLPVTALALGGIAGAALQARGALLDVLDADYIRTLRSRGIPARSVLWRHALRNATPPWLTSLSLAFVAMIGGALLIEKVFAMPGLGTLAVDATLSGDRPVIMGLVVLTGSLVVLVNLLTDLLQLWLVPKARAA